MKKYHIAFLQFVVNTCFAKIFNIRSKDVINDCEFYFNCDSVFDCVTKGQINFYVNMLRLKISCVLQFVHYKRMI